MKAAILPLTDRPELLDAAAQWFHEKWGVPRAAYAASMEDCLRGEHAVPRWYLALEGDTILGGLGVIDNDFHDRKDLAPNVCALYTEAEQRGRGLAGALLRYACADMKARGIDTLYLVTDHTTFYERYGWEFLCMVQSEEEPVSLRLYVHKSE